MDIEKMSNIDINQDSVKSISDKCNNLKDLKQQVEEQEEKLLHNRLTTVSLKK